MVYNPPIPGGHPDLCYHNGALHYAYQDNSTLNVCTPAGTTTFPLGTDVLAFVRVLSLNGSFYVLYREGKSLGGHAVLLRDGVEVYRSGLECGGNNPLALGYYQNRWVFAWVKAGSQHVMLHALDTYAFIERAPAVPGTGIAYILPNRIVTWDENFGSQLPTMTAPHNVGPLMAGEHPVKGALVRNIITERELLLFPNDWANTPRLAIAPNASTYAIAVWGAGVVRIATFDASELQPITAPYPPGRGWTRLTNITRISLTDYLFVAPNWARVGAHFPLDGTTHYTHHMQSLWTTEGVQHTKLLGEGARSALWTVSTDGKFWGLSWDATDQKNGYQIVIPGTKTTAPLYPSVMNVGKSHMRTVNVDILTPDGNRRNVNWRGYVEGVYEGPAVGDARVGTRWANIIWDFDDPEGFIEQNYCAEHLGPLMWFETRKKNDTTRRWFGVNTVPRISDPLIPRDYISRPPGETSAIVAPRVAIESYQPVVANGWNGPLVEVRNANRPDEIVVVEVINGSLHVYWHNSAGYDRSAKRRPITFKT